MANEFRVRKKLIVNGSGSTILDVQGSQGQLFSVTDSLSGSLFSVKDISGIPVIEAFSDDTVNIGTFNAEAIKVSGSFARITGSLFGTASWANNAVTSSFAQTASYVSSTSIIGNLTQIATGSVSASVNTDISASFRITSGSNTLLNVTRDGFVWIGNGSFTNQAYQLDVQGTARFASGIRIEDSAAAITIPSNTAYISMNGNQKFIGNATSLIGGLTEGLGIRANSIVFGNGSVGFHYFKNDYALFSTQTGGVNLDVNAPSGSAVLEIRGTTKGFLLTRTDLTSNISIPIQGLITYITGSSTEGLWYYLSGSIKGWSRVLNDTGSQSISGSLNVTQAVTASNLLVTNAITAQTLVVQTITSSVEFITGSTKFGSLSTDTHQFTGSVGITGSLSLVGPNNILGDQIVTGSLNVSGSIHNIAGVISASNTIYNSQVQPNLALDTRGRILYSNFFATTASLPDPSFYHGMFTHVHNQGAAYYSHGSNGWIRLWDQFNYPGLISGSQVVENIAGQAIAPLSVSASSFVSASQFIGSGSGIVGVMSSSYALTASYVANASSFPYTGSARITGSLTVIGSTTITGSLNVSGSTTQIGNNILQGNTTLSGSIIISGSQGPGNLTASVQIYGDIRQTGYHRFDPVSTNIDTSISASYIYVSGSTNDLYFSQNGSGFSNVTRLRWLEGNLYTGLLHGGLITSQSSTMYQIASGSGIIVNLNASTIRDPYPVVQFLEWPNISASIAPLSASYDQSFVAVLSNGTIGAQGTPYNDGDFNTKIPIGIVLHQNHSTINAVQTFPGVGYGWKQRSFDFIKAFGPLKISGYSLTPSGSSTRGLLLSGGTSWVDGRNYTIDPSNPSYITEAVGIATSKIYRYWQSGSDWKYDTNNGVGYTSIDPTQYSNNGVTSSVASNDWSIQRVFYFPNSATKALYIYYGNATYANEAAALAAVGTEPFTEAPNTTANAIYVGYILLRNDADFTVPASYTIYSAGLFRGGGSGGAGGGGGATSLASLSDVSISSPTDYQPFAYNAITTKWENRSIISASLAGNANTATSASYAGTASVLLGSVVSASYAATSSWSINSITASYAATSSWSINAITSSYSYTSSLAVSASFATTSSYSATSSYVVSSSFATTASYVANINKKVRTTIPFMAVQGQTTYITNIPSAVDEVGTELRIKENLISVASCSLSGRVEEVTTALIGFLKIQYSTDESTWNDFHTNKIDLSTLGTQLTAEEAIPSGAKTTGTYLRLVTSNGDGSSSSNSRFGNVTLNLIYDL